MQTLELENTRYDLHAVNLDHEALVVNGKSSRPMCGCCLYQSEARSIEERILQEWPEIEVILIDLAPHAHVDAPGELFKDFYRCTGKEGTDELVSIGRKHLIGS